MSLELAAKQLDVSKDPSLKQAQSCTNRAPKVSTGCSVQIKALIDPNVASVKCTL